MKTRKKLEWTNYLFILPIFLLFAVFIVYPIVYNFIVSFHEWSGIGADKIFVGFQNYVTIFSGKIIYKILKNFVIFAIVTITITLVRMNGSTRFISESQPAKAPNGAVTSIVIA